MYLGVHRRQIKPQLDLQCLKPEWLGKMAPRPILKPRCHNCRRRKIKVDAPHPLWTNNWSSCEQKCDYQQPCCGQCRWSLLQCEGYKQDLVFISHNVARQASRSSLPSSSVCPSPGVHNRQNIFDYFLSQYLPEAPLNHSSSIKWFSHLPPRPSECPALDSSTNALGVTMLGRKTGDHNLIYNGLKLYGDSLATFRSWQVRHRTGRWHESLLVAMVLQLFEVRLLAPF